MRTVAGLCAGLIGAVLSTAAFAQSSTTLPVKNGSSATVNVAGQQDASGAFHYRDVMEGLASSGAPTALTVDPDLGAQVHINNPITGYALDATLQSILGKLPAGPALDTSVTAAGSQAHADAQAIMANQPSAPALETGHLASIDASTAAGATSALQTSIGSTAHTDAAAILAKQPSAPALETGHIANVDTSTTAQATAMGTKADAKSTATDTTPASVVALMKGEIDRLQALITVLGSPAQAGATQTITGAVTEANSSAILSKLPAAPALDASVTAAGSQAHSDAGTQATATAATTTAVTSASSQAHADAGTQATATGATTTAVSGLATQNHTDLAAIATKQPALNGDGGAPAHVTNFPATQPVSASALPLPSGAARESGGNLDTIASNTAPGAAGTGYAQPTGGSGVLGFLSGIYHAMTNVLGVSLSSGPGTSQGSPIYSQSVNPANFAPGQVSVATTATQIVAARSGRVTVTVENLGTSTVWLGGSGVTTTSGFSVGAGLSLTVSFTGALYGISASAAQSINEYETY